MAYMEKLYLEAIWQRQGKALIFSGSLLSTENQSGLCTSALNHAAFLAVAQEPDPMLCGTGLI